MVRAGSATPAAGARQADRTPGVLSEIGILEKKEAQTPLRSAKATKVGGVGVPRLVSHLLE
jgi:hypothetical protein